MSAPDDNALMVGLFLGVCLGIALCVTVWIVMTTAAGVGR